MAPVLTIIIPTMNEESSLPLLLEDIRAQQQVQIKIIVADGGSTDDTTKIATEQAIIVHSEAGRAKQMNRAWQHEDASDLLLFLHADSRLTATDQLQQAVSALQNTEENTAGHFALNFQSTSTQKPSFRYRFLAAKTRTNRRYTINGDQGLLIRRRFLQALGGFDENHAFLEDQSIANKINKQGTWQLLPGTLSTSARRFESEGFAARYHLMTLMMVCWHLPLDDFFNQASGLYKHQDRASKLILAPYLQLLTQLIKQLPMTQRRQAIHRCGEFALENIWQLFFFVDHLTCYPLIRRHLFTASHDLMAKSLPKIPGVRKIAAAIVGRICWRYLQLASALTQTTRKPQ